MSLVSNTYEPEEESWKPEINGIQTDLPYSLEKSFKNTKDAEKLLSIIQSNTTTKPMSQMT